MSESNLLPRILVILVAIPLVLLIIFLQIPYCILFASLLFILCILSSNEKIDKNHAQVEFKAHYHDGKQVQIHHELSHFVKHEGAWYFLDPTTNQQITMKQLCICGSEKKFKQCCAQFI